MKSDEPSSSGQHGDVSPINGSISNLPEDGKSSKRKEPTSENLSNFSRVTPAQFAYITLSPDSRYQPVRPVSTRSAPANGKGKAGKTLLSASSSSKYAGGGGILMLLDQKPDEPAEFIDLQPPVQQPPVEQAAPASASGATPRTGWAAALEAGPEAEPPSSFEV